MVEKDDNGPNDMKERGGLLGAAAIMFTGLALSRTTHGHLMNCYVTRVRGGIISLIIHKEHRLAEKDAKSSAAVSLMSSDVDGISTGMPRFLEIPFGLVEIGLGVYVLSGFIGISALSVLGPLVATTFAASLITRRSAHHFSAWNKSIELRIANTAKILPQLTPIKMLGLSPTVAAFLQHLRAQEIDVSKTYRRMEAISFGPILIGDLMTPVVVIAAAFFGSAFDDQMSAAKVFPMLTVVSLIQRPLADVLETLPRLASMNACYTRIQNFLYLPERKDSRIVPESSSSVEIRRGRAPRTGSLVRFNLVDIAPLEMTTPLLQGINFDITAGSMTAMIGVTGSGKTTMLQGMMGQAEVLGGSIQVNAGEVGYCGENVWLRDVSIRENVIGELEFDRQRFERVIRACFLEEDLEWLPGGEDYVVGPEGCKLSGGQRQRVGIARTAYAEYPITLLDDAFSSLDHETAVCILYQLCGRNGIFRQAGCTVVFVTSLPECIELADQLLVIDGRSCTLLRERALIAEYAQRLVVALARLNKNVSAAEESNEQNEIRRSFESNSAVAELEQNILHQKGDFRLYLLFIDPIGRVKMAFYTIFAAIFAAGEVLPEIFIRIWIEADPTDSVYFAGYVLIVTATCFLGCLVYWLLHTRLSPRSSNQLHELLVRATMGSTLRFLSTTKTGVLLNRYSQDMTILSRNLPEAFFKTIHAGTSVVVQMGVILSGASYLACILPAVLLAVFFIQRYYLRTSRQVRHLDIEMKAPLYTYFGETTAGLTHIQAFGWQEENINRGLFRLEESQKPFYVMMAIQQWLGLVLGLVSAFLGTSLIAMALFLKGSSSSTSIGLSFMGLIYLSFSLEITTHAWTNLETSAGSLARVSTFTKKTPQEGKPFTEILPTHWPSEGRIEFSNVCAYYDRSSDIRAALRNVSLRIQPGQRIGISGRTGSGKSTLLLAMLGFVEYDGRIEIDGVDVNTVSSDDLRSRLVVITQKQVQFNATIRTNLLPLTMNNFTGKVKSPTEDEKAWEKDGELERLLKSLQIWLPLAGKGGLDAMLDDVGYSKGQIQILCIARAILKQRDTGCKVILVDEATSSMDATTSETVNQAMTENFFGCTVLTIAHHRSSLEHADSVIQLHHGAVVQPSHGRSDSASSAESG